MKKDYTPDDLALFERYVEARAAHRPRACVDVPKCWVRIGPPGMDNAEKCIACGGLPIALPAEDDRKRR